jgi:hypothetical protein
MREGVRLIQPAVQHRVTELGQCVRASGQTRGELLAKRGKLAESRLTDEQSGRERFPEVRVVESSMDSTRQLAALLADQLDVTIIRVTAAMRTDHPTGWRHALLRLEPLWLVGRPGDAPRPTTSLHERPIEVFGDPPGSALYNTHGRYLSSLEQHTGLALRWLGNPGTFDHCHAALARARDEAYVLEFDSYVHRYVDMGIPIDGRRNSGPCIRGPWRGAKAVASRPSVPPAGPGNSRTPPLATARAGRCPAVGAAGRPPRHLGLTP